ncbi:MAG TPA: hypothetical protein PJ986_18710 [Gammaproteobacteria bacterium]|nr:hypothetical protein [Gammaproteobacteria bacterium]
MRKRASRFTSRFVVTAIAAAIAGYAAPAAARDLPFERAPVLSAATLLPERMLAGPNFEVNDKVVSDGFMYMYTIDSRWGELEATSTPLLAQYLRELDAVARFDALKSTKEFSGAMRAAAGKVAEGAGSLVRDPIGSVSGAVSGVGALFGRAHEAIISGGVHGAQEDSALANLAGYSKVKREYAYEFGVDVYSRNPILQEHLDAVARAGFVGDITARTALAAVSGGAGVAISVAGNTQTLNEALRDLPPLELRKRNRDALEAIEIDTELADLFIANEVFTPREQTVLVEALRSMAGTRNRDAFIKQAILTSDADMAYFRHRQAQMYADYHRATSIVRFVAVGQVALGQRGDGVLVFCAPLDALYWTPRMAEWLQVFESQLAQAGEVKGKEIVLGGALSPMARKALTMRGWTVQSAR